MDNKTFIEANPALAKEMTDRYGNVDWVNKYTDVDAKGHIVKAWERDANGNLVDVTEREQLREELENAKEALEKLRAKEAQA